MRHHGIVHRPVLLLALFIGAMLISQAEVYAADATSQPAEPIQSVRFKMVGSASASDGTELKMEATTLYVGDEWMRVESTVNGKLLSTMVVDMQKHQILNLSHNPHSATLTSLNVDPNVPRKPPLDSIIHSNLNGAKDLGEKTIQGHKAHGYQLVPNEQNKGGPGTTIWLDAKTMLPLETEILSTSGPTKGRIFRTMDYEWNVQVDPSLLSLTPPEGYTVEKMSLKIPQFNEQTVVDFLKTIQSLNDGQFPDKFDKETIENLLFKKREQHPEYREPNEKDHSELIQMLLNFDRVKSLMAQQRFGTDWHYAGKGAKLGDKDRPIMWYKPAGKETYRVIDAELNVRDVPANELPKIESVPMTQPAE